MVGGGGVTQQLHNSGTDNGKDVPNMYSNIHTRCEMSHQGVAGRGGRGERKRRGCHDNPSMSIPLWQPPD